MTFFLSVDTWLFFIYLLFKFAYVYDIHENTSIEIGYIIKFVGSTWSEHFKWHDITEMTFKNDRSQINDDYDDIDIYMIYKWQTNLLFVCVLLYLMFQLECIFLIKYVINWPFQFFFYIKIK